MTSDFPSDAERSNGAQGAGHDDAFARLEKEMAKMKDTIGNLSDQISDAASDIGAVAQEQAKRGLKHARANMESIANDASDRLGVVADRAQSQASSLGNAIGDAASDIGAVAQEQARRGLKHARANMQSMANEASDRLGVVADRAQSQAASLGDTLEDVIQERPLSTLALALGLGFLLGVILRR